MTAALISSTSGYIQQFSTFLGENVAAFPFWKGRVALYAILKAMGVGEGDRVILPGFTCVVVPNAVRFTGAIPVYIDNRPGTFHIDPTRVEAAIHPKTKAILIQHTFGIPGPVEEIREIALRHHIPVIEDCAHTFGSSVHGIPMGLWGNAAFFSSQWSKPYTTGLGGIAVTTDPELALKIKKIYESMSSPTFSAKEKLRFQNLIYQYFYSPKLYWVAQGLLRFLSKMGLFVGSSSGAELEGEMPVDHNWRMSSSQERNGLRCLSKINKNLSMREKLTDLYDAGLSAHGWTTAYRHGDTRFLRYPLRVGNKEELLSLAKRSQIELGSWFESPLHPIGLDKHALFGYHLGQCPNAESDSQKLINLPMHEWMNLEEGKKVLDFVLRYAVKIE